MCLQKQLPCCVKVYPCALSGSSLSSDIATQVTRLSHNNAQVSLHLLDVVTCFLLFGGLVFLFPPTRFLSSPSPFSFDTSVSWTSVQGTSVPLSFSRKFNSQLSLQNTCTKFQRSKYTIVSQRVWPNPQPGSAAVGKSITANFPFSKQ